MKKLILISASIFLASSAMAQQRCVTAPVNVNGGQVTLTSSGAKSVTDNQTYIYYATKHHRRHSHSYAGVSERYPSKPVLMNANKDVKALPETYTVSLTTQQSTAAVCPDSTVQVAANINLEKVSSYTGNYPNSDSKMYKRVSKHTYKVAARKKKHIERKEAKIARRSGTSVDVRSAKI